MDVSVLAAVGSFVVSERVLKPKATVLILLGCVLAYDLTTKTHDASSLQVYRGPSLLAFTLLMVAYSLRQWRRNGIACDELLFLPGTALGQYHGVDESELVEDPVPLASNNVRKGNEGDVAAGLASKPPPPAVELAPVLRTRALSQDSTQSSIREFLNSWEDDDGDRLDEVAPLQKSMDEESNLVRPSHDTDSVPSTSQSSPQRSIARRQVDRFRQQHPRITRVGTFFFFRSSSTSTQYANYAPSGPDVLGAALDLLIPVLFNFHVFIETFNHMGEDSIAAKVLPLIFLTVLIFRCLLPPGRRGRFWKVIRCCFSGPFVRVCFRDEYLCDVLTSLIRPFQDVAFALCYYLTVIWGLVSAKYGLDMSGHILQKSWIVHNVVLPSVVLLPLWFRFLQTLRQAYDSGQRWPHLGNAFKYMSAALVILYGTTHREDRRSPMWIICYALAVVYQIAWDTLIDWELFVLAPRPDETLDLENWWFFRISSVHPNSTLLLAVQRNLFQPVRDRFLMCLRRFPSWKQIQLRPQRLYKSESFYYRIFVYNVAFRFAWMLCFVPSYYLSDSGDQQVTFSSDTNSYWVGVLLPVVEIVRRTLWGLLFLELKTIKTMNGDPVYSRADEEDGMLPEASEASSDSLDSRRKDRSYLPSWLIKQQQVQQEAAAPSRCKVVLTDHVRHKLFVAELVSWAVVFVGLGMWATN